MTSTNLNLDILAFDYYHHFGLTTVTDHEKSEEVKPQLTALTCHHFVITVVLIDTCASDQISTLFARQFHQGLDCLP